MSSEDNFRFGDNSGFIAYLRFFQIDTSTAGDPPRNLEALLKLAKEM